MYGGVAKTYVTWQFKGEPFKDKYWYIIAINPKTGAEKKVRWYTDKEHHEMFVSAGGKVEKTFKGKCFGFKDENDTIMAIRAHNLTKEEVEKYFHSNWNKPGYDSHNCWKYGEFFGGIWYAPEGTLIPPIAKPDKIGHVHWPNFVKAAREMVVRREGVEKGFWFEQVEV